jgi:hypothetical protein
VGFLLSSSLTRLPSDLEAKTSYTAAERICQRETSTHPVTVSGVVIARRPGNVVRGVGRRPAESAIPTAPEEVTEPLKTSV